MKHILIIPVLLVLACIGLGQAAETRPYGTIQWLKTDLTWYNATGPTIDTITATGTLKYSQPFRCFDGHIGIEYKPKYTSAAADTDTVMVILYRAFLNTSTATYWKAVDSVTSGGRADTFRVNQQHYFSLAGKGAPDSWWRFGIKKLMGVPKVIGFARNND